MSDTSVLDRLWSAMQSSKGLPALESNANTVLTALMGDEQSRADVGPKIVEDVALTQKVLQLANSPMYGPFSEGSPSVSSAMQVLGHDALLHLVLGAELVTEEQVLADAALSGTQVAAELARTALHDRAEDASIASLLCGLGWLMVQRHLPPEAQAVRTRMATGATQEVAASEVLGMTLEQVGTAIAKRWNLPIALLATLDGSGDPALVGIGRYANEASRLLQAGQLDQLEQLTERLTIPGLDRTRLSAKYRDVAKQLRQHSAAPSPEPAHHASAEGPLRELFRVLTERDPKSLEDLANAMFPALAKALRTSHALLFMLTRSGEFAVRFGNGDNQEAIAARLRVSADFKPTAFHAVIRNNVDVSIADTSKLKASTLPDNYRELLPSAKQFVILPIGQARTTGLLYCDWDIQKPLSQEEMIALKELRDLFVPFFPR